ncbi:uncharacterized protein LOC114541853 [Dendronephthya gigantea]|uniref:uncharacterized protein LOC114535778 n=1 Tax=Dendronephthya gigantea TaxID=151771 RepID=UPI00106B1F32|nr:uncharacterized protein LOC114535778 [Dendronephthya gigantea]XP_028417457.1 uncharacterized protein LOC114541853 [Dendronephthya gigantea]
MVESMQEDTNLSRRAQSLTKDEKADANQADMTANEKKSDEDVFAKPDNENEVNDVQQGLLGRLSGTVYNTTKYAAGTAYGGVTWVAGGVLSTTGTAIGATYNTVSSFSPVTIFRKGSKSKSD